MNTEITVDSAEQRRLQVMMVAEGTYPYHWGGVSTWCHLLLNDLPNVDFTLVSLIGDPGAKRQFALPPSVVDFRPIPIWGVREALELSPSVPMGKYISRRRRTGDSVIYRDFLPLLRSFLDELFTDEGDPHRMAAIVHGMYRFFLSYDFDKAFRSPAVWRSFVEEVQYSFPRTAARYGYAGERFTLADITTCYHWLYHWLFPLAEPLPKVDVVHGAMAGVCTLVAVAVKLEHGAAYMLTEHGIYLRERYLAEAATAPSFFRKLFSLRFARRMTELSYALADLIAPCCDYNQRWELRNGATPDRLQTIYYGVDSGVFTPEAKAAGEHPVVVWVGRIDPLKDLITLLRAAAIVHAQQPDVEFRLFGNVPSGNEAYYSRCVELQRDLGLDHAVTFAGFRSSPVTAFNEGDVVVLSSVSEAFPFVILEAMLCEKPVVATGVGGIPEQLAGCGVVVEPRNHEQMAEAILRLLAAPELRQSLGAAARQKAVQEYSMRQSAQSHIDAYIRLANSKPALVSTRAPLTRRYRRSALPFMRAGAFEAGHIGSMPVAGPGLVQSARSVQLTPAPGVAHIGLAQVRARTAAPSSSSMKAARGLGHAPDTEGVRRLAAEVGQRDARPIDSLEVAAILESIGITDDVAMNRYGAPDVFELAEAVRATMADEGVIQPIADQATAARASKKEMLVDFLKGPLGLLPPVLLLLAIAAVGLWSGWPPQRVLFLSAGVTASLMLTNGLIQGISRRASIYIGTARPRMAAHYLLVSTTTVTAVTSGFILLGTMVLAQFGLFASGDLAIFLLAFGGLTVVWMASSGLMLMQKQIWLSIALAAGMLCAAAVSMALAPYTSLHLAAGVALGFTATLGIILYALNRGFARLSALATSSNARTKLPALVYMLDEAAPYFAYGFAYMVLIFLPHIYGWFGALPPGQTRAGAVSNIEVGLTLSLPPLILAYGMSENALRRFWRRAAATQARTAATNVPSFGSDLVTFVARQRWGYVIVLTVFTIAAYGIMATALANGWVGYWLQITDPVEFLAIFAMSLVAYWLIGLGLYNCMFAVTLGWPRVAFRAVIWSGIVMVVAGTILGASNYAYSVAAFALAAAVFAVLSWQQTKQVLRRADYSFASVLS
ncbi:MAG: GT4 family glycosyltransferase PelF [Caldilineaceae bacterium]